MEICTERKIWRLERQSLLLKEGTIMDRYWRRRFAQKKLSKLSKFYDKKVSKRSWSKMCELKNQMLLQKRLNDLVPIKLSFITNSNICYFVIKNEFAIEFKFETFTHVQMGWFYFKIEIKNNIDVARTLCEDKKMW